jgi:hypothetical protein
MQKQKKAKPKISKIPVHTQANLNANLEKTLNTLENEIDDLENS